jgi:hypothetical protein
MAVLVWFMIGIALWHFTVWLPDHFWQGIVGAFLGAVIGAMISGAIFLAVSGRTVGNTDLTTALEGIPGTLIGLAIIYAIGLRAERAELVP